MGKPQAAVLAKHLQKYRVGDAGGGISAVRSSEWTGSGPGAPGLLGWSMTSDFIAASMSPQPGSATAGSGPGLLRMAMSAAKSMSKVIGKRMKTVYDYTH